MLPRPPRALLRTFLVIALVAAAVAAALWLRALSLDLAAQGRTGMVGFATAGMLLLYALLLALPFVPGAEIGAALLVAHGAAAAPFVWGATLLGLGLAYAAGRALSTPAVCAWLAARGWHRLAELLEPVSSPEARLAQLEARAPRWLGQWVLRRRYLLLAALLNLPGNSILGGGGGILMAVGASRLFRPLPLLLTLALATAPLPLLVMLMGPGLIR
ncbi:hypothetical protein [Limimaricola pyoseonensis]|uniref:TVP38/TMEM64 family membrane protein n=1 Tax=Limimaricola pyoseonensis TaxID=521013 RepID=A0A1G7KX90_9RHOB|nr:hypothetical protein [Limimaricola pyoseonensis]SDF41530.1 hypothetical protein SAMN04488567_0312 [Limimaricola pyoseonensis]